jgi:hypothetical protein
MPAFAFLSLTCQLGQEGEGFSLRQTAFTASHDARRLAMHNADCVPAYAQQYDHLTT